MSFGLLYAVKQQYILNLTNVWLYFVGRGNMATAAFFRDLRAWDWSFFFFIFNRHCWFPSSLNPQLLFQGWCRHVFFFFFFFFLLCEGTAHTSMENKHYSCFFFFFLFSVTLLTPYRCVHPWMCLTLVLVLSFLTMKGSHLSVFTLTRRRWSHISERWIHGGHCHHRVSVHLWGFLVFLL